MRVFHFMRYKWWFLGSLSAVTVFAFVAVFIVGLNLGIDFRGGVRMEVALEKPATVDEVRSVVSGVGVQGSGCAVGERHRRDQLLLDKSRVDVHGTNESGPL